MTYKAKGVVPDTDPWFGGILTNGSLERDLLERADAFLAVGLDPVELLPRDWKYPQPVYAIGEPIEQNYYPVHAQAASLDDLILEPSEWNPLEVVQLFGEQLRRMMPEGGGLRPHCVVQIVAEYYRGARITVDAGAHMFPVMALWPAQEACGALISNGLSTMGFALPAAIGAALLDRERPVVAFTGDGGLMMCVSELRTAAREKLPVRVIVFDDRDLTLIRMKQVQRGYREDGVAIGDVEWVKIGEGFGVCSRVAGSEAELSAALEETKHHAGPVLIAARIDAATYVNLMRALRG